MKKIVFGFLMLAFAVCVSAEDFVDVEGNQHDRIWKEMQANQHRLATGASLTNGLSVYGKPVAVASAANTLIQQKTEASGIWTTYTNTFATSYASGTTPTVVFTANNVGGTNTLTVASNLFTIAFGMTNVTVRSIAVGIK